MIQLIIFFITLTVLITLILNTGVIRKHIINTWTGIAYHYKSKKATVSVIELRKRRIEFYRQIGMEDAFYDTAEYELYDWNDTEEYETYDEIMKRVYNLLN